MELKYILAIVGGGLFLIAVIVFLVYLIRIRNKEAEQMEYLEKMYSDKNLVKMDYDFAVYDEETEKILAQMHNNDDGQLTIDDVMAKANLASGDTVFGTVDTEGPEEITGNYKPD